MGGLLTSRRARGWYLVAALAALALAPEASAASAQCTVTGQAATVPAMPLFGSTGVYSFGSGSDSTPLHLTCVVRPDVSGVGNASQYDVQDVTISSVGTFENIICGRFMSATSTSSGTPAVTRTRDPVTGQVLGNADLTGEWSGADFEYEIEYRAGAGTMLMTGGTVGGEGAITAARTVSLAVPACTFEINGTLTLGL